MMASSERYDKLHFTAKPSPERHPDRLASIGLLCGLNPVDARCAKILDIGCGIGANTIAIAQSYPYSTCVGVDVSAVQIEQGQEIIKSLKLSNVELRIKDVQEIVSTDNFDCEKYDYIICHGVYSWVAKSVRLSILKLIKSCLSPNGLAMISFLGRQGWHIRGVIFDYLISRVDFTLLPEQQIAQARELLSVIKELQVDDMSHYGMLLRSEIELIESQSDALIFHELLNPDVRPYLVKEFKAELSDSGLDFCADLRRYDKLFSGQCVIESELCTPSCLDVYDIVSPMRMHSVLVCDKEHLNRNVDILKAVECLCISSPHVPLGMDGVQSNKKSNRATSADVFVSPLGQEFQCASDMSAMILTELANAWPSPVPVYEIVKKLCSFSLLKTRRNKSDVVLEVARLLCDQIIAPHTSTLGINAASAKRPVLGSFTLYELAQQNWATNKRHEFTAFSDVEKRIALLMDGTKTLEEISNIVLMWVKDGSFKSEELDLDEFNCQNETMSQKSIAEGLVSEVYEKLMHCAFF